MGVKINERECIVYCAARQGGGEVVIFRGQVGYCLHSASYLRLYPNELVRQFLCVTVGDLVV